MWHTSRGDRTLRGEEAALVRNAIDSMVDTLLIHIDDDLEDMGGSCESGVALYDALSASQRIGLLHDVARHLLTETETTLPLSAPVEATVAAIFVDIRDQVAIEIDFPSTESEIAEDQPTWRQMVLEAYTSLRRLPDGEYDEDGNGRYDEDWDDLADDLPVASCRDIRQWELLIENLVDSILWDRDFEMADSFLDVDPGVSRQRRRLLGIDEDYFTSVAPDPRPDQVLHLVSKTRDIVRAKPR
jgi:hypothetical protein